MRCDAMRCDAMRCDAMLMRCDAMRCDAMRCDSRSLLIVRCLVFCLVGSDDSVRRHLAFLPPARAVAVGRRGFGDERNGSFGGRTQSGFAGGRRPQQQQQQPHAQVRLTDGRTDLTGACITHHLHGAFRCNWPHSARIGCRGSGSGKRSTHGTVQCGRRNTVNVLHCA